MDKDTGQSGSVDRERGLGGGDGDQSGAEPGGGARGEPGGAGHHRTTGDEGVPAAVFVALGAGSGKCVEPP